MFNYWSFSMLCTVTAIIFFLFSSWLVSMVSDYILMAVAYISKHLCIQIIKLFTRKLTVAELDLLVINPDALVLICRLYFLIRYECIYDSHNLKVSCHYLQPISPYPLDSKFIFINFVKYTGFLFLYSYLFMSLK